MQQIVGLLSHVLGLRIPVLEGCVFFLGWRRWKGKKGKQMCFGSNVLSSVIFLCYILCMKLGPVSKAVCLTLR